MAGSLVFIDKEKPDRSFVITQDAIEQMPSEEKLVKVVLKRPRQDRSGERSQLLFRLVNEIDIAAIRLRSGKPAVASTNPATEKAAGHGPQILTREAKASGVAERYEVTLPVDTVFRLRLNQGISSHEERSQRLIA